MFSKRLCWRVTRKPFKLASIVWENVSTKVQKFWTIVEDFPTIVGKHGSLFELFAKLEKCVKYVIVSFAKSRQTICREMTFQILDKPFVENHFGCFIKANLLHKTIVILKSLQIICRENRLQLQQQHGEYCEISTNHS